MMETKDNRIMKLMKAMLRAGKVMMRHRQC